MARLLTHYPPQYSSTRISLVSLRSAVPALRGASYFAAIGLLAALFAANVYRAATQSITHDEGLTYRLFVAAPWDAVFNTYDANHHVLHTILAKIAVDFLGVSPFTLRIPSLLGGLLYFALIFRICDRLFGGGWYLVLSTLLLSLNPYLLDFQSAARGYGLAVAFFVWAIWEMLEWLREPARPRLILAGVALALSVSANLVLAPPAAGLALSFLAVIWNQRRTFQPQVTVTKKGTRKETPNPYPSLGAALTAFILPFVGIAAAILISPLSKATGDQFYVGTASLMASAESLVRNSLPLAPEWLTVTLALAVVPALLIACSAIAWQAARQWTHANLLNRSMMLLGGSMLVALIAVIGAHLASDVPYPEGRTGIYWIPLLTLSGLIVAKLWQRATLPAAIAMAAILVAYAAECRLGYYADWQYDQDSRTIARLIGARQPATGRQMRLEGSWRLEPSMNFYRVSDRLDWLRVMQRDTPKPGADFYVLTADDAHYANDLHLKTLFQGRRSGTILAVP